MRGVDKYFQVKAQQAVEVQQLVDDSGSTGQERHKAGIERRYLKNC